VSPRYRYRVRTVSVVSEEQPTPPRLDEPDSTGRYVSLWLDGQDYDRDREHVGFVAVDGRHRLCGIVVTASGTATQAPVDAAQFWQRVFALGARAVILFHTHPSGDREPSRDDLGLTKRLVDGGNILGVPVYDHLILTPAGETGHGWLSLRGVRPRLFETSPGVGMSGEVYS